MYLFTRTAHLAPGNPTPGITWAAEVCTKVHQLTDQTIQLWTTMYSPGVGTLVWSAWFDDLPTLERVSDKLQTDGGYQHMLDDAKELFVDSIDDALMEPVSGEPDPARSIQYVTGVNAVPASGSIMRAMGKGVEIAERVESTTGQPTMFLRTLTGPYGGVGWITAYESISSVQVSESAIAADEEFLRLVDESGDCFQDDPQLTQQVIYRRLR